MKHEILDINSIIFQKIELMKIEHTTNSIQRNSTEFISNLSSFYFLSVKIYPWILLFYARKMFAFKGRLKTFLQSIGMLVVDWRGRIMFHFNLNGWWIRTFICLPRCEVNFKSNACARFKWSGRTEPLLLFDHLVRFGVPYSPDAMRFND